ncbi:hypothetical protein ONZ45_g1175 [Pleurotus djamor]|nr:hypothetical protein ONZ45_g1175 [Pleurotus djamor]
MAPFAVAFNLAVCLFFLASASASAVIARSADELAGLLRRQTSISYGDIPAGCQSSCSSMVSTINSCSSLSCFCTSSVASSFESCVYCSYNLMPTASQRSNGQALLDTYNSACSGTGISSATFRGYYPSTSTTPSGSRSTSPSSSNPFDNMNGASSSANYGIMALLGMAGVAGVLLL